MDNSQIENTINEIRKRSGIVTVFTIMIFAIGVLMLTDNFVFAQEEETQTGTEYICDVINCKLSGLDIIIELGLVILVPVVYLSIQKSRKRKSIIKIWQSKVDELNDIQSTAINNNANVLSDIIFELEKMEIFIAESFSDTTYIGYTLRIRFIKQLIDNVAVTRNGIFVLTKNWLEELIRLN